MPSEKMHKLISWYERRIAPAAFVAGFILDSFTLTRVDLWLDNLILLAHFTSSLSGIALVNAYESGKLRSNIAEKLAWLFPLMIQFSFGALFSGFVVLYWRSGSLAGSWLFFAVLAAFLVGNEFFRERYRRLLFHVNIYFIALFSYAIFAVPLALKQMGPRVFALSGLASLAAIAAVVALLGALARQNVRENLKKIAFSTTIIFTVFNFLYFANIIPPIPLALKHLEVYHSLERTETGGFRLAYEPAPRFAFFRNIAGTFRWQKGDPVYAFSAVFAPTAISAVISHHWLYYDALSSKWIEKDKIALAIAGGRDGGYRGYTFKKGITPGKWRVEVRTERGQLLGRRTFEIVETTRAPTLKTREL